MPPSSLLILHPHQATEYLVTCCGDQVQSQHTRLATNNDDNVHDSPTKKGIREINIYFATRRAQSVGDLVRRTLSQYELTQLGLSYAARRDVLRELFTLLSLESPEGVEMSVLRYPLVVAATSVDFDALTMAITAALDQVTQLHTPSRFDTINNKTHSRYNIV